MPNRPSPLGNRSPKPVLTVLGKDGSANGLTRGVILGSSALASKRAVDGLSIRGAVGCRRGYTNPPANPSSHRSASLE